jgi:predicted nucleotide-binding protein
MTAQKRVSKPEPAAKPELAMPHAKALEKIQERIGLGMELGRRTVSTIEQVEEKLKDYEKWNDYNKELLNAIFTAPNFSQEYSNAYVSTSMRVFGGPPSPMEKLKGRMENVKIKIQTLESILERLELIPVAHGVATIQPEIEEQRTPENSVFVVHGHDEAIKQSVARLLEKLGLQPIILHEKATEGRTIIEKLEYYSDVDFAVILLTPDDIGADKEYPSELKPRARQNVILELGFFLGRLGRNKVCPLYRGPMDLPSDYIGVGYILMDDTGAWKYELAKELKTAGFNVDMNKI